MADPNKWESRSRVPTKLASSTLLLFTFPHNGLLIPHPSPTWTIQTCSRFAECCRVAQTLQATNLTFLLVCLVLGGGLAAYCSKHWLQQIFWPRGCILSYRFIGAFSTAPLANEIKSLHALVDLQRPTKTLRCRRLQLV